MQNVLTTNTIRNYLQKVETIVNKRRNYIGKVETIIASEQIFAKCGNRVKQRTKLIKGKVVTIINKKED